MKSLRWPLLLITFFSPVAAFTADLPWVNLVNGTDFAGWKIVGPANLAPVTIEDGAFVLRQRAKTSEHTFLTSEKTYGDFILELELKDDPSFNTGILLRCADAPKAASVRLNGYQVKIDPSITRAWTGGIFDDFGADWKWLYDLKDDSRARAAFKLGEWARFRIECIGHSIKVWVNGVPTTHLIDDKYSAGYLALKIHSLGDSPDAGATALRVKNIRIITDHPELYQQPIDLAARRVYTGADANDGDLFLPEGLSLIHI
jgi:hypothetical protein